jgi:integrase/recombinase XerD
LSWHKRFLASCKRKGLSANTIYSYEWLIDLFVKQHKLDLEKCTEKQLFDVLDKLTDVKLKTKKKGNYKGYQRSTYRTVVVNLRHFLRFIGREDLASKVELPKKVDRKEIVKRKVISKEDILKLINGATDFQDRLLIQLFYESGARRSEIHNLRIKDVQFDEYSAILWLTGKTGTRTIRVYAATPDLVRQINEHPEKKNPEARLFHFGKEGSSEFTHQTIYMRIRNLGERVLGRPIHPHQLRHTRATEDSSIFTDREMMLRMGWARPDVISIYSHLSRRDVDDKDLVLHGFKPKEEFTKPILQIRKCPSCKTDNAPYALYCYKCSKPLSMLLSMSDEDLKEHVMKFLKEAK